MSKRRNKKSSKKNKGIIKYDCNNISQDKMIEIQAESYYRAFKKIENEKNRESEQKDQKKKYKWYEKVAFVMNVLFWPWKINKKFHVKNGIYDSVLVLFVTAVLYFIGAIMWLTGIVGTLYMLYEIGKVGIDDNIFPWNFISMFIGSTLILAGEEFSKETDSNKIYAYSASIIALISCVVGIVVLIMSIDKGN